LVQEQSEFPDGSAIRLTIARYFTPTGRCIQKPYEGNYEQYENELMERLKRGELLSSDSIHFADSLKYITPGGHTVYGGGGIMPDVFVSLDTSGTSPYYSALSSKGLVTEFAYNYLDQNRKVFRKYKSFEEYNDQFHITDPLLDQFVAFGEKNGVQRNEEDLKISNGIIRTQLKALIARQLYRNEGFYAVIHTMDKTLQKAVELVEKKQVAIKGS
jgi:carboxyl-terminal processing protease